MALEPHPMSDDGSYVLITGGTKGIGLATAQLFAESGQRLILTYRRDAQAAKEAADQLRELNARDVILVECDLSEGAKPVIDAVEAVDGRLAGIVFNAAASAFKPLLEMRAHHVAKTFGITVGSMLELVQGLVGRMSSGSSIVTISSGDSIRYIPGHGLLGAAKAAVEVLTRYLAVELAPQGIRANCVLPGPVATESARTWAREDWQPFVDRASAATPLGRLATPQDVAPVVHMLCRPEAGWVTGQVLVADGGMFFTDRIFVGE